MQDQGCTCKFSEEIMPRPILLFPERCGTPFIELMTPRGGEKSNVPQQDRHEELRGAPLLQVLALKRTWTEYTPCT
eukprot:1437867-Rhodomonas_salina.4